MTDKELLEAAAKAAGIEVTDTMRELWMFEGSSTWNPLEKDADAFDLQVRLLMDVDVSWIKPGTVHVFAMSSDDTGSGVSLECSIDEATATARRAVTLAAARLANAELKGRSTEGA